MDVQLSINTPEEKKDIFERAKCGEYVVQQYLMQRYSLHVFTYEELAALNLLLVNKVDVPMTHTLLKLVKQSKERWDEYIKRGGVGYPQREKVVTSH